MALAFVTPRIEIPSGTGMRVIRSAHNFGRPVNSAAVALNGFKVDYASDDHHINVIEANTAVEAVTGSQVSYRVVCQFADKNFDDEYSGFIDVLLVADVV
jgi:hypothetical protein